MTTQPQLWYAWSNLAEGFYDSSIVVCASDDVEAVFLAVEAMEEYIREGVWIPGMDTYPDEDGFEEELACFLEKFREEMKANMKPIGTSRVRISL